MANKSLTDLTARTATADSDLLHINSGGTDYKETKQNFLQGSLFHDFNYTQDITVQADALLPFGTYIGRISSYGHQSETGVPDNDSYYVYVERTSYSNIYVRITSVGQGGTTYYKIKSVQGWASSWTKEPTRSEITSLNNSLPKSYDTGILSDITIASNREASIDKPSALIGKEIISINILSWSSASGVFFIAGMYDASPRFFIGGDPGTVIRGLNLRIWYKG